MTTDGRFRTLRRGALLGSLFALSLAASFVLADRVLPEPRRAILSEKLVYLGERIDEPTTLFLGSSRVFRGLVPAVYDEEMALRGHTERSFNLGVPLLLTPESLHVLREILAQRTRPLRRVFIELAPFEVTIPARSFLTDREVGWHDTESTRLVAQGILESELAWQSKVRDLTRHGRHLLYRFAAVGRGRLVVPGLEPRGVSGEESPLLTESLTRHRGWLPLEVETGPMYARRREHFLQRGESYQQDVQAMGQWNRRAADLTPYQVLCIERVVELAQEYGFEAVFVILPLLDDMRAFHRAHAAGTIPRLLAFDSPSRFPELYAPERRFDDDHLTRAGSRLLTRLMVEWLDVLEKRQR